jgi:hypothetical protein
MHSVHVFPPCFFNIRSDIVFREDSSLQVLSSVPYVLHASPIPSLFTSSLFSQTTRKLRQSIKRSCDSTHGTVCPSVWMGISPSVSMGYQSINLDGVSAHQSRWGISPSIWMGFRSISLDGVSVHQSGWVPVHQSRWGINPSISIRYQSISLDGVPVHQSGWGISPSVWMVYHSISRSRATPDTQIRRQTSVLQD